MKKVLAIKKIKKGQKFIIEGSDKFAMYARPVTLKMEKNLGKRFPSKEIFGFDVEKMMFPVGQIFVAEKDIPKYTIAMVFNEGN